MCYYSQGGFTHDDIYSMPTYLRNFYSKELIDVKKREKKEADKASKKSSGKGVSRPSISKPSKR